MRCYNRSKSALKLLSRIASNNPWFAGLRGMDRLSGEDFIDEDYR